MISPAARKHAQEKGVDLDKVAGTGPHGAVTLEDVEKAAAPRAPAVPPLPATTDRAVEMRKAIAAAMARSKREIPHYYVAEDIPLAKALAWMQARERCSGPWPNGCCRRCCCSRPWLSRSNAIPSSTATGARAVSSRLPPSISAWRYRCARAG